VEAIETHGAGQSYISRRQWWKWFNSLTRTLVQWRS